MFGYWVSSAYIYIFGFVNTESQKRSVIEIYKNNVKWYYT